MLPSRLLPNPTFAPSPVGTPPGGGKKQMFICSRHGCGMAGIPQGTRIAVSWGMLFSIFLHSRCLGKALAEAECINAFPTKKSGGLPFGVPLQKRCRRNELPDLYYDIKTPAGRNGFKGRLLLTGYFTHFTPPQPGMHFYLSPAVSRRG